MTKDFKTKYWNTYFRGRDNYIYLKVLNISQYNLVDMIWWDDKEYKHTNSIGQWKRKIK